MIFVAASLISSLNIQEDRSRIKKKDKIKIYKKQQQCN